MGYNPGDAWPLYCAACRMEAYIIVKGTTYCGECANDAYDKAYGIQSNDSVSSNSAKDAEVPSNSI